MFYYFLTTLTLFINSMLGWIILRFGGKDKINLSFFLVIVAINFWIISNFIADNVLQYQLALFFTKLTFFSVFYFFIFLSYFIVAFSRSERLMRIIVPLNLIVSILFLYPIFSDLIVRAVTVDRDGVDVIFNSNVFYYLLYVLLYLISSFLVLFLSKRRLTVNLKEQVNYIIIGLLVSTSLATLTQLIIPLFFNYFYPSKFGHYFVVIFVGATTYAMLKHELLDIKLILTKFASYGFTSIVVFLSYLIPISYINNKFLLGFLVIPISFLWAFYFKTVSELLITTAKRKFFQGYYESDKVLKQLAHSLQFQSERKQMLIDTLRIVDNALEVEHTGILIAVRDEADQIIRYDHIQKDRVTGLPLDSDLIQELSRHYNVLSFNDLPPEIQLQIDSYKLKSGLIVPLHSPEVLEGALILGQKGTQKAYTEEDNTLLFEVQTVVTSLFYKLTPYEKLQAEFMKTKQQLIEQDKTLARTEKIASLARVIQEYNHEIKTPLSILGLTVRQLAINFTNYLLSLSLLAYNKLYDQRHLSV